MGQKKGIIHTAFRDGFTIVELLIVVVVIGILATITVISYNGISTRAHQTALASDAHGAAMVMGADQATGGSYPGSESAANGGKGLPKSPGTSYSFHSDGTSYCITANSSYSGVNSYYVSNTSPSPTSGQCPADLGVAVTTIAGNGTLGFANSPNSVLASPAALTADSLGNLYFSDGATSRIRKMTTSGTVSTLAGNGSSAYAEGTGTGATFNWPQSFAVGPGGILYIADSNNSKIRTLSTSNASALFAGSTQGNGGVVGTTATNINFNIPRGIVFQASSGNIIVADSQNNRIVQLNSAGTIVSIIGQTSGGLVNATGTAAKFSYPQGVVLDSSGNLFVADTQNHAIRKVTPAGVVTTYAGTGIIGYADGSALSAQFKSPGALTIATDGTIYVSDSGNNRIRKIATDGTVTTIAGSGVAGFADGNGTEAQFNNPNGIAIGSDGRLYVADTANHRIRVLSI